LQTEVFEKEADLRRAAFDGDRLTEPNLRLTLLTFCSMLSNDSKYLSSRCFPTT
jgi:hypothetical protein